MYPPSRQPTSALSLTLDGSSGATLGGNIEHAAPEVLNCRRQLSRMMSPTVVVTLDKQPVFDCGVCIGQLIAYPMSHPLPGYPFEYEAVDGSLVYDAARVTGLPSDADLSEAGYPLDFAPTLRRMVACDPADRPSLRECRAAFAAMDVSTRVRAGALCFRHGLVDSCLVVCRVVACSINCPIICVVLCGVGALLWVLWPTTYSMIRRSCCSGIVRRWMGGCVDRAL